VLVGAFRFHKVQRPPFAGNNLFSLGLPLLDPFELLFHVWLCRVDKAVKVIEIGRLPFPLTRRSSRRIKPPCCKL